jgi:hypothetical protein
MNRAIWLAPAMASLIALPSIACFVGYDSRWGEAKRAQQRVAASDKPATISAEGNQGRVAKERTLRMRARPSARYLAETVDAPKQIASLIDDANGVLSPALACRLELERIEPWSRDVDEAPEAAIAALSKDDTGEGVDLVVGMIGALPRETDSLHLLGIASLLGKYVVVRAASRADEHDAIDKGFYELSEDERLRMIRARKHHRSLAAFLHEVGHALGALHENDPRSLMRPIYDPKASGFGAGGVALMRISLDETDPAKIATEQLALLRGAKGVDWVPAEREQRIAALDTVVAASTPPRGVAPAAAVAAKAALPPGLRAEDGPRFTGAWEKFQAGDARAAHELAQPLYTRYPDEYAVQDLRCQLAMLRWLDRDEVTSECAPLKRLSPAADGGASGAKR